LFSLPNIEFLLVFFVYGLAFFSMGLVMLLESRRSPLLGEARLLLPLAIFGFVHGTHEWVEMFLQLSDWFNYPELPGLAAGRLLLLSHTCSFLGIFSIQASTSQKHSTQARLIYLGAALLVLYLALVLGTGVVQGELPGEWIDHADAYARYLLAVPAAVLAALGLARQARLSYIAERPDLATGLRIAAWSFAAYSLTQMVVSPAEIFPARVLNTVTFYDWSGLPIQVVRAAAAVMVTVGVFRAAQAAEDVRKEQMAAAQQARVQALAQTQRELEAKENLRRQLLQHTVNAQEEERTRIARELHDETAQFLTALSLDLATLRGNLPQDSRLDELLDRLQSLSQQMSQGISRMVRDLRPAQLDDLGLEAALTSLVDDERRRSGMDISLEVRGSRRRLDPLVETVLFRVAQEAMTNVVRHSHADKSCLQLVLNPADAVLRVEDWGVGIEALDESRPGRGWGIAGMRERVESVGGMLRLESTPGKGTMVEAVVPLPDKDATAIEEND
jgi:two-component system sensor histidine kinase UhpB